MPLGRTITLACAVTALAAPVAAQARDEVATGREAPGFTAPSAMRAAAGCAAGQQTRTIEHFVISYDTVGTHRVPDESFVDAIEAELKRSYDVEVTQLGWRAPQGRTPVCLSDVGAQGNYGYASPGQLTLDNDYKASQYPASSDLFAARKATIAHEFNHVLQFLYGASASEWQAESVATWAEEQVFDQANDYVHFVNAWADCPGLPLTFASGTSLLRTDPCRRKVYGAASFNHWLSATYGKPTIRAAYENLSAANGFGPLAYGRAIGGGIPAFRSAFARFAAASAEWRVQGPVFPDRYKDVARAATALADGGQDQTVTLDHTAYALLPVLASSAPSLRLHARLPAGVSGAIALVGRTGSDPDAGTVTTDVEELPDGGAADVALDDPDSFGRITAVLVNTDVDPANGTWLGDGQPFCSVRVSTTTSDATPDATCRAPATVGETASAPIGADPLPGTGGSAAVKPSRVGVRVAVATPQRRTTVVKRGLAFRLRCSQRCSARATLTIDRRAAGRLGLSRSAGSLRGRLTSAGSRGFRISLPRSVRTALGRQRRLTLTFTLRTRGDTGPTTTLVRRVTIVR